MSLLKTLLVGRENGIRAKIRRMLGRAPKAQAAPPPPAPRHEAGEKALNLGIEPPKDVTPPDGFEVVLHKDALKPGRVIEVIIGGKAAAIANVDGNYYAVQNTCPHAQGPLGEGSLVANVLTCPHHGWQFDVRDGTCLTSPDDRIRTYEVQVVRDAVCVRI